MAGTVLRIHPSIGFARVGNSDDFYLAPETLAAAPGDGPVSGGLPIEAGTESKHITSAAVRDAEGALKRQAARFRIFRYDSDGAETYPNGGGTEVRIGDVVDGRTVADVVWTVHVANKKANCYVLEYPSSGLLSVMANYEQGLPPLRNPTFGDPNSPERVRKLTIDPGPRTVRGRNAAPVDFDQHTVASFCDPSTGAVEDLPDYPKSFPSDGFEVLYCPSGEIDSLGRLLTDDRGRLLVAAAGGRACAWFQSDGNPYPLSADVDNDGWFDDTADGPVSAVVVFDDGGVEQVHGAWVVATDPSYAPQTPNVVTLWDDIFDTWVRKLALMPSLFDVGFNPGFCPSFDEHVLPFFRAAAMQRWNTDLPPYAVEAHDAVGRITAADDPRDTLLSGLGYIRNPNNQGEADVAVPLMPLSLGDAGAPFMLPTFTQYFFLSQWDAGRFEAAGTSPALGPGEFLDKASLFNCLGGRFSPGIDMTFCVRDPELWEQDWQTSGGGPFRIKPAPLDYRSATAGTPFLTQGYVPIHTGDAGLEPGDTSKFMALPWHTDYNSCATHPSSPNPTNSSTLYWSWPAQRPVSVYVAADVVDGELPSQRYSIRGPGTESPDPSSQGRYLERIHILSNWWKIGTVMQGSAIGDGGQYPRDDFLEVQSKLEQGELEPGAEPWPLNRLGRG